MNGPSQGCGNDSTREINAFIWVLKNKRYFHNSLIYLSKSSQLLNSLKESEEIWNRGKENTFLEMENEPPPNLFNIFAFSGFIFA